MKLTEIQLRNIIRESVREVLSEEYVDYSTFLNHYIKNFRDKTGCQDLQQTQVHKYFKVAGIRPIDGSTNRYDPRDIYRELNNPRCIEFLQNICEKERNAKDLSPEMIQILRQNNSKKPVPTQVIPSTIIDSEEDYDRQKREEWAKQQQMEYYNSLPTSYMPDADMDTVSQKDVAEKRKIKGTTL